MAGYIRNGDGVENFLGVKIPQTESVSMANSRAGLQDTDRLHEVRSQDKVLLPVNTQPMRRVLLAKYVQRALYIFRPLMNDVEVGIRLDQTARRGAHCRSHVSDVETSIRLRTDFIRNGAQKSTVALPELGTVGVGRVKVVCSVLIAEMRWRARRKRNMSYTYLSL